MSQLESINVFQDIEYVQSNFDIVHSITRKPVMDNSEYHADVMITIGRLKQKITINELSHMTKIPVHLLRDYESGKRKPDICAMNIIEKSLNINVSS